MASIIEIKGRRVGNGVTEAPSCAILANLSGFGNGCQKEREAVPLAAAISGSKIFSGLTAGFGITLNLRLCLALCLPEEIIANGRCAFDGLKV